MAATEPTQADAVARELQRLGEQVEALQAEVRRLGPPESVPGDVTPSFAWVGSLDPPVRRRPAVPRFLLEACFLVAAAALAVAADLEPLVIVAVMAVAWAVVALAELAAAAAERRRAELLLAPPPARPEAASIDAAWFSPPVEHTLLEGTAADSETAVTRLPPVDESTMEQRPER
jgi:hypothetical protein